MAVVDLVLDGRIVATLDRPPWNATIDLGAELQPHRLVAIGKDRAGSEVAHASQLVNMPRFPAEASVTLVPGKGGQSRRAVLSWQNALGLPPTKASIRLDGRVIQSVARREIDLPPFDPNEPHILRAELDFPENLLASAEVVFGGREVEGAQVELTGVPVVLDVPDLSDPERLRGRFLVDGRPVRVVAVESGPTEIVVVRDEAARSTIVRLEPREAFQPALRPGQSVRFCWPVTRSADDVSESYDVFMRSPDATPSTGYLHWLLTRTIAPAISKRPRFADAIGVAGVSAVGRNRGRAVLFLTGGTTDASRLSPSAVRKYLSDIHVPLYVWAVDESSLMKASAWGKAQLVRDTPGFLKAAHTLIDEVAAQRIVWLDGLHLPQSVSLAPGSTGMRIAR